MKRKGYDKETYSRDIDKHKKAEIEETVRQIAKRNDIERDWESGETERQGEMRLRVKGETDGRKEIERE